MADEWMQSTKDTANAAMDKTADAAQSAKNSAPENKEQAAGFLQQVVFLSFFVFPPYVFCL